MRKVIFIIMVGMLITLTTASAQAHMLWFNTSNYTPDPGETVWIEIGWGHEYPRHEIIKEGWLEQIYAVDPNGKEVTAEEIFPSFYKFTPKTKGIYRIVGKLKSGFLSITNQGHKLGSKKDVADVVSCFQYIMNAKGIIQVGGKKRGLSQKINEPLGIIPLKEPAGLKVGDTLPLKIMFQDKPLAGAKVQATYTGYKGDKKHLWAMERESDSGGIVHIKLTSRGQWLFKTGHKTPYPDKAEADEHSYSTCLTVGIE